MGRQRLELGPGRTLLDEAPAAGGPACTWPPDPARGLWRAEGVLRLTDLTFGIKEVRSHRLRVVTGLRGAVVEIGLS